MGARSQPVLLVAQDPAYKWPPHVPPGAIPTIDTTFDSMRVSSTRPLRSRVHAGETPQLDLRAIRQAR